MGFFDELLGRPRIVSKTQLEAEALARETLEAQQAADYELKLDQEDTEQSKINWRKINIPRKERKHFKYLLANSYGEYCQSCKRTDDYWNLELDHKQPKSRGGSHWPSNLQLLCSSCNKRKGNR